MAASSSSSRLVLLLFILVNFEVILMGDSKAVAKLLVQICISIKWYKILNIKIPTY